MHSVLGRHVLFYPCCNISKIVGLTLQGGRDMNPADAFRKVQRQKEIQRNKRERQFQRDASKLKSEP